MQKLDSHGIGLLFSIVLFGIFTKALIMTNPTIFFAGIPWFFGRAWGKRGHEKIRE